MNAFSRLSAAVAVTLGLCGCPALQRNAEPQSEPESVPTPAPADQGQDPVVIDPAPVSVDYLDHAVSNLDLLSDSELELLFMTIGDNLVQVLDDEISVKRDELAEANDLADRIMEIPVDRDDPDREERRLTLVQEASDNIVNLEVEIRELTARRDRLAAFLELEDEEEVLEESEPEDLPVDDPLDALEAELGG